MKRGNYTVFIKIGLLNGKKSIKNVDAHAWGGKETPMYWGACLCMKRAAISTYSNRFTKR